jgi:hypothetical protein
MNSIPKSKNSPGFPARSTAQYGTHTRHGEKPSGGSEAENFPKNQQVGLYQTRRVISASFPKWGASWRA